jgi:hypothetical protein
MIVEDFKKFELSTCREERIRSVHLYHYPLSVSWGLFTEETDKALAISALSHERLYEKFFRQGNTNITFQVEMLLNWLLDHGVLIPQPAQVRSYLFHNFNLTRLLQSTCKLAMDRFAAQSQLSLEVYCDSEIEDTYLTLYIRQPHYNEDILKRIEELRAEYEIGLTESSGWFLITTDFRPPL